jgi:heme A synthase
MRALFGGTLALCYLQVLLGDTVRVTESGMGCRSWPLCNGSLGLSGNLHALLEQSHRYLATVVTIAVLACLAAAFRERPRDPLLRSLSAAGAGLILLQVALGALTVLAHNAGWTVALHLAGAWLLLGVACVAARHVFARLQPRREPAGRAVLAGGALSALLALAASGMVTLHTGAARACPSWPICLSTHAPTIKVLLQYVHRAIAVLAGALVVWLALAHWRAPRATAGDRSLALVVVGLLAGTAALGGLVATTGAPAYAQDLHLALASALWVAAIALAVPHLAAPAGSPFATGTERSRSALVAGVERRSRRTVWTKLP